MVLLNSQLLYNYVGSYNINNKPENFLYSDLLNAMQFAGNTVQKSVNSAQNKVTLFSHNKLKKNPKKNKTA